MSKKYLTGCFVFQGWTPNIRLPFILFPHCPSNSCSHHWEGSRSFYPTLACSPNSNTSGAFEENSEAAKQDSREKAWGWKVEKGTRKQWKKDPSFKARNPHSWKGCQCHQDGAAKIQNTWGYSWKYSPICRGGIICHTFFKSYTQQSYVIQFFRFWPSTIICHTKCKLRVSYLILLKFDIYLIVIHRH